jgi:hypothetical protein
MAAIFASCNKDNGINNISVIATPYTLYFCDTNGALWNTNDGVYFKPSIFPSDGVYSHAIMAEDSQNLIWIKDFTVFLSTNNGQNFNPTYSYADPSLDQTQIIYMRDWKRLYIASAINGVGNSGIVYNWSNGRKPAWRNDTDMIGPAAGTFHVSSYTQLKNGSLIAFDKTSGIVFIKNAVNATWNETVPSATGPSLPSGGNYTLGHYNNTLVAVDRSGVNGAWYSTNLGASWQQYTGLPNRPLYVASSPFDAALLVGTDSAGVFTLQTGVFAGSSSGLDNNVVVRGVAAKENIFVNGLTEQFIYIATNKGIFRSQDLGQNWVLVRPGNYYNIY